MQKRKSFKRLTAFFICMVMMLTVFAFPKNVQAAAAYQKLPYGKAVQVGSYYFKLENGVVSYSDSEYGDYTNAGFPGEVYSAFVNGVAIYAIENRGEGYYRLSRYTVTNNSLLSMKRLSLGNYGYEPPGWDISAMYQDAVFLTRTSYEEWTYKTYVYNINTGEFDRKMKNCKIESRSSKYVIARNEVQTDVSAHRWTLYQIDGDGNMTKTKTLGSYIGSAKYVDSQVYYSKYADSTMSTMAIYRCDRDGSNTVKFGTISFGTGYENIVSVSDFKKEYCFVYHDGTKYKFTYATKELTKVG